MPEGIDEARAAFQQTIDPVQKAGDTPGPLREPQRDDRGRFAQVADRPEPIFQVRMTEGDPETGDVRDGGDDTNLRAREKGIADGWIDERQERVEAEAKEGEEPEGADEEEEEGAEAKAKTDDEEEEEPQYEITVDGEPTTVSLGELRDGYIRTATFHSRLNKVNESRAVVDQEHTHVTQLRDLYVKGLQYLDEDLREMMPAEPDWDAEFAKNPQEAHLKQKDYQKFHAKLNQLRQNRAWAIQNGREENDRRSAQYATDQFTQFVQDHAKLIKDEPSLRRIVGGMRQTALAEDFTEQEVAGVYDKRMLNILLKAYLYDQGMAVRPQAVIPGKGKALVPGSARPINGSAGRRNIDEAQRQLARTGRMEDATAFFDRLLR